MNRIKELRKEKNITVKSLSEKLDIAQSMLTNYENGSSVPRDNEVWNKLADYFDVSVPYIMGLTDRPQDYIKGPLPNSDLLVQSTTKPFEIYLDDWKSLEALLYLKNLDKKDLAKTVKYMYEFLQDSKYDNTFHYDITFVSETNTDNQDKS